MTEKVSRRRRYSKAQNIWKYAKLRIHIERAIEHFICYVISCRVYIDWPRTYFCRTDLETFQNSDILSDTYRRSFETKNSIYYSQYQYKRLAFALQESPCSFQKLKCSTLR